MLSAWTGTSLCLSFENWKDTVIWATYTPQPASYFLFKKKRITLSFFYMAKRFCLKGSLLCVWIVREKIVACALGRAGSWLDAGLLRLYVRPVNPYAAARWWTVEVGHDKVCFLSLHRESSVFTTDRCQWGWDEDRGWATPGMLVEISMVFSSQTIDIEI